MSAAWAIATSQLEWVVSVISILQTLSACDKLLYYREIPGGLLSPNIFSQLGLLDWILVVSVLFLVAAIAIAIVLLVLTRRVKRNKQAVEKPVTQDQAVTEILPQVPDIEADTVLSPPRTSDDKDDTSPSLPIIQTVGVPITVPESGQRPPNIGWQIAGLTDVGLKRELNEDSLRMIEAEMAGLGPYGIYIVADGLGGHAAGEVASKLTIDTIEQQHSQNPPGSSATSLEEWLKQATIAANEAVLNHQKDNSDNRKMGSTLVMALVVGQNGYIINVGDSRAYHLNSSQIEQISVDHSLVERLIQIGQITREEARTHKQKNVIYSTIGERQKLEIGFYQVSLNPGDRLLLCSDGLSNMVSDEELLKISRQQPDPARAIQVMVDAAKQAGGHDNITAIIIQMN
jgi:protein phosphatase